MYRVILLVLLFAIFNCTGPSDAIPTESMDIAIIPQPLQVEEISGSLSLELPFEIQVPESENWQQLKEQAQEEFAAFSAGESSKATPLTFVQDADLKAPESYTLEVMETGIQISAADPAGAYRALQSLKQLLPASVWSSNENHTLNIPLVVIKDEPRFAYRGMHLDVARHFFPPEDIKRFIDQLAFHKFNYFHWHLTDDQGWRIEIKRYPKLTSIGGTRKETLIGHYNDTPQQYDGKAYSGHYTQEEVKEIVKYAADRHIIVVPEIEMPGHAQAVLAAYPELACTSGPFEVATKWGVFYDVFCPTDTTFRFLEEVLLEVMELFPSPFIHVGGDECPKDRWKASAFCQNLMKEKGLKDEMELQSYFIGHFARFLDEHGRRLIGWDEILEGGLPDRAAVMSWRGTQGGIEAAQLGHDVVMTPTSHCYFDYYQSSHPDEPLAIGGFLPLKQVYSYEPIPSELTEEQAQRIIGVQANIWTEYITTRDKLDYMAFPRVSALAEVAWTNPDRRDYADFAQRLLPHLERLEGQGINVAKHLFDLQSDTQIDTVGQLTVSLKTDAPGVDIHYTLDGTTPTLSSPRYASDLAIKESSTIQAQAFQHEEAVGRPIEQQISWHSGTASSIDLAVPPHEKYSSGGTQALVNGIQGRDDRYGDKEWLGFEGQDLVATIDLGEGKASTGLETRFYQAPGQWIYPPAGIRVFGSEDGGQFELIAQESNIEGASNLVTTQLEWSVSNYRFLKIEIQNYGIIPEGLQGGGHPAWLFVDELILN